MDAHNKRTLPISEKVKSFTLEKVPFRIYHASTLSTRPSTRTPSTILDISSLSHIIGINESARIATAEVNVPFDALVTATLKHDLIPAVVPSFPGVTVGGAYSSTSAQSASSREGFFDDTVVAAEFVLGDGGIIWARKGENGDLLRDAAGACGTLGVVTCLEIKLLKAKKYVELEYVPVTSFEQALKLLEKYRDVHHVRFMDALMFSPTVGVVMLGQMTNHHESLQPIQHFNRAKDPWFYMHAHSQTPHDTACPTCPFSPSASIESASNRKDLIPLEDYLFRFDRGNMWMGTYGQIPEKFGWKTRWLMDWLFRTRTMYKAMHHAGRSQIFIVQDITVPFSKSLDMLDWADGRLGIYPLWLCPIGNTSSKLHNPVSEQNLLNISLWGLKTTTSQRAKDVIGPAAYERFVADNRAIEAKTRKADGFKWNYAQFFHNADEFWGVYDVDEITKARKKWNSEDWLRLLEKCRGGADGYVDKGGLGKAFWKTLLGKDHLLGE